MKKAPTDFRRITLRVHRMEPVLTIYRDILGMQAYYDKEVSVTVPGDPPDAPKSPARLVILQCNDPYVGMLGFMQLLDASASAPAPAPRPVNERLRPGEGVLVMTHDNVEVAYEKLKGVEGVQLVDEPRVTEFPRGDGGVFRVEGFRFLDPNGFFVDLNQTVE
jgi:catechol 2,3-dioxygenase-like lactoylglutathione lyase family enzyme